MDSMEPKFRTYAAFADDAEALASQAQGAMVRPLAPEDAAPGMYITVMCHRHEWFPDPCLSDAATIMMLRPMRWDRIPKDSGLPLRVAGVCLPFVFVQTPTGKVRTLDVRKMSLARLTDVYGREAFARLARAAKSESSDDDDDE